MRIIVLAVLFASSLGLGCSYCKSAGANLPKTNAATEAANAAKGGGVIMKVVAPKSALSGDEFFKSVDGRADDDEVPAQNSGGRRSESEITYTNAYQD